MSRIGKMSVPIPGNVDVTIEGQQVSVKGPKGALSLTLVAEVVAHRVDEGIRIEPLDHSKRGRSMWGLSRSLVENLVSGVTEGFQKTLEINGVGCRAHLEGQRLKLQLGFSHEIFYQAPEGIELQCPKPTQIIISGIEKQKVGQVAAEIRHYRPPEPYKGKGIKYSDEYIFRKEGKKK